MSQASPVLSYPPATAAPPQVGGPALADLCATARTLIQPMVDAEERFGPAIESGFIELVQLVDRFEKKHVVGKVASYHLDEALEAVKRIREAGHHERGLAGDGVRSARASLASISVVPPVADLVDGLLDREIRDTVRGFNATKRAELLEQMRNGGQVRAILASARNPMPTDFDVEAAELYGQFSEPQKRRDLTAMESIYRRKQAAAQTLIEAADAAKQVVARFIQLEAALFDQQANVSMQIQGSTITRPGTEYTPTNNQPPRYAGPSVEIEGSAITRMG